jgi:SAM-dependent methyltransferase
MESHPPAPEVDARLAEQRRAWRQKPALRIVYEDYYERIRKSCVAGPTLEVGGGSGNFRAFDPQAASPGIVSIDILSVPWLDAVADAQALPFAAGSFANLVMVDVLHHLPRPLCFLQEAARVLRPGGRLILIEPAITPVSWIAYRFFHPEPVRLGVDPLTETGVGDDPFDSNQAIPTLLFTRQHQRLAQAVPELALRRVERLSLLAYPLSGGFRPWSLLPSRWASAILKAEERLAPALGHFMAFRLFVVLERK